MKFSAAALTFCLATAAAFTGPTLNSRNIVASSPSQHMPLTMAATIDAETATATDAEPTVMRPPINLPWDSISSQVCNISSIHHLLQHD